MSVYTLTEGNDLFYDNAESNEIIADAGDDRIFANEGNDTVRGNSGNDSLYGWTGNDLLNGGNGNDVLYGEAGNDVLNGGNGNDSLYDEEGRNTLNGGNGDDRITSGDSDDMMYGGANNDFMVNYGGSDMMYGNGGNDNLYDRLMSANDGAVSMDGGTGADVLIASGTLVSDGAHVQDTLSGGDGNDLIINTRVTGALSTDRKILLSGGNGNDIITSAPFHGFLQTQQAEIYGGAGNDTITVNGVNGADYVDGGDGNDVIERITLGTRYPGELAVSDAIDTITGGAGNDTLIGGRYEGTDHFSGGEGDDVFVYEYTTYRPATARTNITFPGDNEYSHTMNILDFEAGADSIVFKAVDTDYYANGTMQVRSLLHFAPEDYFNVDGDDMIITPLRSDSSDVIVVEGGAAYAWNISVTEGSVDLAGNGNYQTTYEITFNAYL
jgi:Ca2+-binding RTX toxin-like protein